MIRAVFVCVLREEDKIQHQTFSFIFFFFLAFWEDMKRGWVAASRACFLLWEREMKKRSGMTMFAWAGMRIKRMRKRERVAAVFALGGENLEKN